MLGSCDPSCCFRFSFCSSNLLGECHRLLCREIKRAFAEGISSQVRLHEPNVHAYAWENVENVRAT